MQAVIQCKPENVWKKPRDVWYEQKDQPSEDAGRLDEERKKG